MRFILPFSLLILGNLVFAQKQDDSNSNAFADRTLRAPVTSNIDFNLSNRAATSTRGSTFLRRRRLTSFDPNSPLTSYWDSGSCGPRGDDAQEDVTQCLYGANKIADEEITNIASIGCVVKIDGCCYKGYKIYECKTNPNEKQVPFARVDFSQDDCLTCAPYTLENGAQIKTSPGGFPALRIDSDGPYAKIPGIDIGPSNMPDCTLTIGIYLESIPSNALGWIFGHEEWTVDRTIILHDSRQGFLGPNVVTSGVGDGWMPWANDNLETGTPPTKEWFHVTAVFRIIDKYSPYLVAKVDFSQGDDCPTCSPYDLEGGAEIKTAPGGFQALRIDSDGLRAKIPNVDISPSKMPDCTLTIGVYLESVPDGANGWIFGHEYLEWDCTIVLHEQRVRDWVKGPNMISSVTGSTVWKPWADDNLGTGTAPTKEWFHVTAVFRQGGDCVVYVNGVKSDHTTIGNNDDGLPDLYVGHPLWSGHWSDAWIKEVKVYSKALSDIEVQEESDKFLAVIPSSSPSNTPSYSPSLAHSLLPSSSPSEAPSEAHSILPSSSPSDSPSEAHSILPSSSPSDSPSEAHSILPSSSPSEAPSEAHSILPSSSPSDSPSEAHSILPASSPSEAPSEAHSILPSFSPSDSPSEAHSILPSSSPSDSPSEAHSILPSSSPSEASSSSSSSSNPSSTPSVTTQPSVDQSMKPSNTPSNSPSQAHSILPSSSPKAHLVHQYHHLAQPLPSTLLQILPFQLGESTMVT